MKNIVIVLSLLTSVSLNSNIASASAAVDMNNTGMSEAINSGTNASFGAQHASRCGRRHFMDCVMAAAGYAQMAMSLMQMMQTMGSRDALSPGTDWTLPDFPSTFGPISPNDQGSLNPIITAIQGGSYDDYLNAKNKLMAQSQADINKLKAEGVTFDAEKGTITTPNGTKNISDYNMSDSAGKDYQDRLAKILDTSGGGGFIAADGASGSNNRGLASSDLEFKGSSVDSFLKKLDQGELDNKKLVGMSKNTKDGDAVGVAVGDIFKTMHTKYKSLNKANHFK